MGLKVWSRLGARRAYTLGAGVFALGTVCCALASNIGWLIAARSVQGWAGGLVSGSGMALINAEYRVNLGSSGSDWSRDPAGVFVFYDAGRVTGKSAPHVWQRGVGFGVGGGGVRLEFGFRVNDIPASRQILVRFSPTF